MAKQTVRQAFSQFWPFMRPCLPLWLLGIGLTVPVGALDAVIAAFLKPFMDEVMISHNEVFVDYVPFIIIGFAIIQGVLVYASAYVNGMVSQRITLNIRYALFRKLLHLPTAYFDKTDTGDVLFKCYDAPGQAIGGMISNLKLFLTKFFSSVALCGVMFYQSWQLSLLAIGVALLLILPMLKVRERLTTLLNRTIPELATANRLYHEATVGSRLIKSYGLSGFFVQRFAETAGRIFSLGLRTIWSTNWLSPVIRIITSSGIALVLYLGLSLVVEGTLTPGGFIAFIAALIMLYAPLKTIGDSFLSLQRSMVMLTVIYEVLDAPEEQDQFALPAPNPPRPTRQEIPGGRIEEIVFDAVDFGYRADTTVLRKLSLTLKSGHKYALVGDSGCGKTTVTALLLMLYRIGGGAIRINGCPIEEFTPQVLRQAITPVFQDTFLFDGTIRENLVLDADPVPSEERLHEVLQVVHLDEFVRDLPEGLNTRCGERGVLLSGGQKQRLGIARALLRPSSLIILDEATSALDNTSELIIKNALQILIRNKICLMIAHRLSTIRDADCIFVLDEGHVCESGTYDELMARQGRFYALHQLTG